VAFDCCRYSLGWPVSIEAMAKALGEPEKYAAQWRAYGRGDHDPSAPRLQKMEKAAPGTIMTRRHDFWLFLADERISKDALLRVIHRLPFELAARLIHGPDLTSESSIRYWIDDEDYFYVQSLGNLDAVTALLATAELQMREAEYPGRIDEVARAFRAATRLLVRLSLVPPIRNHISDIFALLQKRYPYFSDDLSDQAWLSLRRDYELVLMVIKYWDVVPQKWPEQRRFLSLADRKHFDVVVLHAKQMLSLITKATGAEDVRPSKLIEALLAAYADNFGFRECDAWFSEPPYPGERLKEIDELLLAASDGV
jgi:hypothetical protein